MNAKYREQIYWDLSVLLNFTINRRYKKGININSSFLHEKTPRMGPFRKCSWQPPQRKRTPLDVKEHTAKDSRSSWQKITVNILPKLRPSPQVHTQATGNIMRRMTLENSSHLFTNISTNWIRQFLQLSALFKPNWWYQQPHTGENDREIK
jgi:hypothetical protein